MPCSRRSTWRNSGSLARPNFERCFGEVEATVATGKAYGPDEQAEVLGPSLSAGGAGEYVNCAVLLLASQLASYLRGPVVVADGLTQRAVAEEEFAVLGSR